MKYYVLVVKNNLPYDIQDDIDKTERYFEIRTPLDVKFEYLDVALPLKWKKFWENHPTAGELWGLDGIKQQLRDTGKIKKEAYHAVAFFYDANDAPKDIKLGAYAYPNDLFGAPFCEIPCKKEWEPNDGIYRMFTHELIHDMHRWLWSAGVVTKDTMDVYDKEFDTEATDGNRARNLAEISPYWPFFYTPRYRLLAKSLIVALDKVIELMKKLVEQKQKESMLVRWARAIETYENMDPSYNNPGALRYSPYQDGSRNNFAVFNTYEKGWNALLTQLKIACTGKSQYYKPENTLLEFFAIYAPAEDHNDPKQYAMYIANQLGISPNTQIKELYG